MAGREQSLAKDLCATRARGQRDNSAEHRLHRRDVKGNLGQVVKWPRSGRRLGTGCTDRFSIQGAACGGIGGSDVTEANCSPLLSTVWSVTFCELRPYYALSTMHKQSILVLYALLALAGTEGTERTFDGVDGVKAVDPRMKQPALSALFRLCLYY